MTEETRPENLNQTGEGAEATPVPEPEGEDSEREMLAPEGESAPFDELERRLAEPILRGNEGIETAQVWISAFLIGLISVIVYSNTFSIPAIGEDREFLQQSAGLRHFAVIDRAIEAMPGEPVAAVVLGLNAWLTGGSIAGLHAGNILFHVLNAILLYMLCRTLLAGRASEPVAMLAGLLFALHPLSAGTVNFLLGRAPMLALFFSLCSILLYLRSTADEAGLRVGALAGAVVCLVLAVGSSSVAAPLPLMVVAAEMVLRRPEAGRSRGRALAVYLGVSVVLAVAATVALRGVLDLPPQNRWMSVLAQRLVWMASPSTLSAYHASATDGGTGLSGWQGMALMLLMGGLLPVLIITLLGIKRSAGGFALAWLLLFSWSSVQLAPETAATAERSAYFALAGLALLLPWLFTLVPAKPQLRTVAGIASAVLVVLAGIVAFNRNNAWENEETYWRQALQAAPKSAEPRRELGRMYLERGQAAMAEAMGLASQNQTEASNARQQESSEHFRAAEQELAAAVAADPTNAQALYRRGQALEFLARPQEAIEAYRASLRIDPGHAEAAWHLAVALQAQALQTGDRAMLGRAVALFEKASERKELPNELRLRYAQAVATLGDYDKAYQLFSEALAGRDDADAQNTLQGINQAVQSINGLRQQVNGVMQANPGGAEAAALRGRLMAATGRTTQASYLLGEALKRNPQDFGVWMLLGVMAARMGSTERFVQEHATPPPPPSPPEGQAPLSAWQVVATSVASEGMWDAARTYLEAAQRAGDPRVQDVTTALGEVATQVRQPARAMEYLQAAAEARPTDPLPWLYMTDVALLVNDPATARAHLTKAMQRGAPAEEVEKRRAKLGDAAPPPTAPSATPTGPVMIR